MPCHASSSQKVLSESVILEKQTNSRYRSKKADFEDLHRKGSRSGFRSAIFIKEMTEPNPASFLEQQAASVLLDPQSRQVSFAKGEKNALFYRSVYIWQLQRYF